MLHTVPEDRHRDNLQVGFGGWLSPSIPMQIRWQSPNDLRNHSGNSTQRHGKDTLCYEEAAGRSKESLQRVQTAKGKPTSLQSILPLPNCPNGIIYLGRPFGSFITSPFDWTMVDLIYGSFVVISSRPPQTPARVVKDSRLNARLNRLSRVSPKEGTS